MSTRPFKVKAVYEYASSHEDDLNFSPGQIITVTDDDEEDWYTGEYTDASGVKQEGIFPRNFVEKYEPTAPPRPNRAGRSKKDIEPPSTSAAPDPVPAPVAPPERVVEETHPASQEPPVPVVSRPEQPPAVVSKPAVAPAPKASASPPVAEKPSGGSFKDRIAAFNITSAPPPAPFKPSGLGSGNSAFIRKPFVAPPPSKDAYVPPPREAAPQRIYRREEDPEIAAKEAENQENAERAGLAPGSNDAGSEEDQPKPTSLKERIALLQKQQMEQAARHAEAAQKKEKPKRPAKKRTESHTEGGDEVESAPMEKAESQDTIGKASLDSTREDTAPSPRNPPRRKSSKGPPGIPDLPRESFGDGNEADMSGAGDETEEVDDGDTGRDDSDDKPRTRAPLPLARDPTAPLHEADVGEEEDAVEEEEEVEEGEEEEDEETAELRRKEEIRARMAKMSGGMGMYGMFGAGGMPMPSAAPAAAPKKKKPSAGSEHVAEETTSTISRAPPVPIMALPGLSKVRSPEETKEVEHEHESHDSPITGGQHPQHVPDVEDIKPADTPAPPSRTERPPPPPSTLSHDTSGAPPVPGSRPAPPPVPTESRPPPTPRPVGPMSPSAGSESDDELSLHGQMPSQRTPLAEVPLPSRAAPPSIPIRPPEGPVSPTSKRTSYFNNEVSPTSPTTPGASNKRSSKVPPIPGASPILPSSQSRPPPPPPPNVPLSRSSTGDVGVLTPPANEEPDDDKEEEEEVTEYEGDYDTDIASTAPHKDALKGHTKDSRVEEETPLRSPIGAPPPLPPVSAPRAVPPPPPPSQAPSRRSNEVSRAAPPPPPPAQQYRYDGEEDDEYDPYKYTAGMPPVPSRTPTNLSLKEEEELYSVSPPRAQPPHPHERAAPPPPPRDVGPPPPGKAPPHQSIDIQRAQTTVRRSTDLGSRMSTDSGNIAHDVDLGEVSLWWTHPNTLPPVFSGRTDILYESEESTATKRGGKSTTTKDLYILFQDYSQTVISVRFDPHNPSDASLEQRHEPPPARLRQDQLEESYDRFGRKIFDAASSKKDSVVGDGTPQALVNHLLSPFPDALRPVGFRAYGALVYANMANASTSQNDEIRPGDIVSMRNAKFQGKHGAMHAKYSIEVGAGQGHVAVVAEWDGTKKKVRAWEQGRDSKKVKLESFKLDDLRSGEVKVWRVMPRSWVGWEGEN